MASSFYEDIRKEALFGTWLDKNFYSKIAKFFASISRNQDLALQKRGVDVILEKSVGGYLYVDEKASLHYINKNIPTFAFELKNLTSGNYGWLYNPEYLTDLYLLAWPFANDENIPSYESFTMAEIMLIKRTNVISILEDNGVHKENIDSLISEYLPQVSRRCNKFSLTEDISLNFNQFLAERPINLVVKKKLLKEYSTWFGTIKT